MYNQILRWGSPCIQPVSEMRRTMYATSLDVAGAFVILFMINSFNKNKPTHLSTCGIRAYFHFTLVVMVWWHTPPTPTLIEYIIIIYTHILEWNSPARQQFVHEDTERPQIGRYVVTLVQDDLGGHVFGGATKRPRFPSLPDMLGEPKVDLDVIKPVIMLRINLKFE